MPRATRTPTVQDIPADLTGADLSRAINDRLRRLAKIGSGGTTIVNNSSVTTGGGGSSAGLFDPHTLTASTTAIASPGTPTSGVPLVVELTQDATGGRQVTWAATFELVTVDDVDVRANKVTSLLFMGNGTKWRLVSVLGGRA